MSKIQMIENPATGELEEHDLDAQDAAYEAFMEEQTAIAEGRATQLMRCYLCPEDVNDRFDNSASWPLRGVVRIERGGPWHDPSDMPVLTCGHWLL